MKVDADKLKEEIDKLRKHYLEALEYDMGYNKALDDVSEMIINLYE